VFATGNDNKVKELKFLLTEFPYEIVKMADLGFHEDIPETGETLEENAVIKAEYLHEKIGGNIISEDTGLEVEALDGAPGIHTARFAGPDRDPIKNMNLLVEELNNQSNRSAQFHTVICLILDEEKHLFHGFSKGRIGKEMTGGKGFGYDPIFIPDGFDRTFAQMELEEKSMLSHRVRAFNKMHQFLIERNT